MSETKPVDILGIIADGVTTPRNDGSRGSALYTVPIRLSRMVSETWAKLFEQNWDNPPVFSTSHRRGICRVLGDRIVLDGTTLDEVESTHKETLKLVLKIVNAQVADIERRTQINEEAERSRVQAHIDDVKEKANRIKF